jgi:CTP synthase
MEEWREVADRTKRRYPQHVEVGVIAKYMDNQDTYMSVFEALRAAAWWSGVDIKIKWIDAEKLETTHNLERALAGLDGIVVPGGFGIRGLEGKIKAARYALNHKLPYLGLCLGLQMGVIAAARNAGLELASSGELDPLSPDLVINTMEGQAGKEMTGGTMRLGNYPCVIAKDSLVYKLYGETKIEERHRHRYECNNDYRDKYESWGIKAVGTSPDGKLVEIIEAIDHPFFVASQFHPEFRSRPSRPHPMFKGFIASLVKAPEKVKTRVLPGSVVRQAST